MRLPGAESNSRDHPNAAGDFGGRTEAQPEQEADHEAENWWSDKRQRPFLVAHHVAHESGGVHAHEGDERAEIQHLSAKTETLHKCAYQRDSTDKQHVIPPHSIP